MSTWGRYCPCVGCHKAYIDEQFSKLKYVHQLEQCSSMCCLAINEKDPKHVSQSILSDVEIVCLQFFPPESKVVNCGVDVVTVSFSVCMRGSHGLMSESEMAALIKLVGLRLAVFCSEKKTEQSCINRGKTALAEGNNCEWCDLVTWQRYHHHLKLHTHQKGFTSIVHIVSIHIFNACVNMYNLEFMPPSMYLLSSCIMSASLMDSSPRLPFLALSSPPFFFLPYHIHVSPWGLIKRLSTWGEGRRWEEGGWQRRRVVLITPYVWTGEGGEEVLVQLINSVLLCASLPLFPCLVLPPPQSLPLEIMCLVLTLRGRSTMTEIQFIFVRRVPRQNSAVDKTTWVIDSLLNLVDCMFHPLIADHSLCDLWWDFAGTWITLSISNRW